MTREPRHRNRLAIGRPRTSTLVLIGLFLGFLTLYVWVRPIPESNTGNIQQVTPTHSQTPSTPASTPTPSHRTLSPTPSHSTAPSVTQRHADAGHLDGHRHGHADTDVLLDRRHVAASPGGSPVQ